MNIEKEVADLIDKLDEYRAQNIRRDDMRLTVTRQFRDKLILLTIAEFGTWRVGGCNDDAFPGVPLAIQEDLVFPPWRLGFVLRARPRL